MTKKLHGERQGQNDPAFIHLSWRADWNEGNKNRAHLGKITTLLSLSLWRPFPLFSSPGGRRKWRRGNDPVPFSGKGRGDQGDFSCMAAI
jgi:hypothetical protein